MKCLFAISALIFAILADPVASKTVNFSISLPENDSNGTESNSDQFAGIVIRTKAYYQILGIDATDRNVEVSKTQGNGITSRFEEVEIFPTTSSITTTPSPITTTTISPEKLKQLNEDLFSVAFRGDMDVVKNAIENGADVNARDEDGWPVLQLAALGNELDVVKYLIEKGADINAKRNDGSTALDVALSWGEIEVARVLKNAGGKAFIFLDEYNQL